MGTNRQRAYEPTNVRTTEVAALLAQLAHLLTVDQPPAPTEPVPSSVSERVLLTVEEAAERLGIGKTKVYALVMAGEIASVRIGRLRRIHIDSVSDYAAGLVAEQATRRDAA